MSKSVCNYYEVYPIVGTVMGPKLNRSMYVRLLYFSPLLPSMTGLIEGSYHL
jgi:hypothetical protein